MVTTLKDSGRNDLMFWLLLMSRGVGLMYLDHVINYDMPGNIEMYTHRVGRTGRAGKTGTATKFLTLHDTEVFYDLKQMLTQSNSHVPPELARHEASKIQTNDIIKTKDIITAIELTK
ncbi:putative RNA helicase [Helianthus annuus]|nr:putative RNA helicase [Helianthus annuus]